ncbi:MAG: DUF2796 domain-containing protein, partial [Pseudomonadota bacterium]
LGFETSPQTEEQRQKLDEFLEDITSAGELIIPDADGRCEVLSAVEVSLPESFDTHDLDDHLEHDGAAHDDDYDANEHANDHDHTADIDITVSYSCARPGRVRNLTVNVFSEYSSIETVDAVLLTDRGQAAARLNTDQRILRAE